jgi:hypothetical protein
VVKVKKKELHANWYYVHQIPALTAPATIILGIALNHIADALMEKVAINATNRCRQGRTARTIQCLIALVPLYQPTACTAVVLSSDADARR